MNQYNLKKYNKLQRRLKYYRSITNYNYRGDRTFVVISGLNSDQYNLSKVVGLDYYEERMLFFLFLLKYKRTKIIYVATEGLREDLINYYLEIISSHSFEVEEMKKRLKLVYVPKTKNKKVISLSENLLNNKHLIKEIKSSIKNRKQAVLRCYNPTNIERMIALKLDIPLFGPKEKYDYVGTKSGARKVFKSAGLNIIDGYSDIKNLRDLSKNIAKLIKKYPHQNKLVIKLEDSAAGRGNSIFDVKSFLDQDKKSHRFSSDKLTDLIYSNFNKYLRLQDKKQSINYYLDSFNKLGGIVELYIESKYKNSPSVQLYIPPKGLPRIISTHEQILGGPDHQKYLGCSFPANNLYRKKIITEAKKVAKWMAKKGVIGNFSIDFIAVRNNKNEKYNIRPIEINLRKGGTTHPLRIAQYITRSKYQSSEGILYSDGKPIYYLSMEFIESKNYKNLKEMELVNIIKKSKLSFNGNTNRGVLVYMPGMITKFGKFGAISIAHSSKSAEKLHQKMVSMVDNYVMEKFVSVKKTF